MSTRDDVGGRPPREFGINTWVWTSPLTDGELEWLVPHIAELGYDFVEMPVEEPGVWDADKAAGLLADSNVGGSICCVMPPGRDLATEDADTIRNTQQYLKHCVDVAVKVGSGVVAGPTFSSVGRLVRFSDPDERASMIDLVARNLVPVADYAAENGVKIAIEPLNRYESSFINTVDQALDLIERAGGHEGLGLLLDSYHMNIEERDPAAAVLAAGDRVAHVHTCGTDRGAPGRDQFGWDAFFDALDKVGYSGRYAVESFTSDNEVIATATAIWRPLADSPDALASDGLAFLRSRS